MHKKFDPLAALEYARKFSRPRKVGTGEEKLVAGEIADLLRQFGYAVHEQVFRFSTVFERLLVVEILIGLLLVSSILLTKGINEWLTLFQVALLIFLNLVILPLNQWVQRNSVLGTRDYQASMLRGFLWKLGSRHGTKNLVAVLPEASMDSASPQLYLVAHYDSKSQHLPLVLRIGLYGLLIAGSLMFSVLAVINLVFELPSMLMVAIGILVIASGIPLLFSKYGNDSAGAIDNASGLGLVLYLAEFFRAHPEQLGNLGVTILITGAEEMAVKGALAYAQEQEAELHKLAAGGGLYVLNLDGIGVDGQLYLVAKKHRNGWRNSMDLRQVVQQCAAELNLPIGGFNLPGALFDHVPFVDAGFDACSLIGIGKNSMFVHTAKDSPDKLHQRGFEQAGRLALQVIENLSLESTNHK